MATQKINVVIGSDTSGLDRGLNKSRANLAKFAKVGAAAIAAVGVAMVALTKDSLANIDAMAKQARSIGLTSRALQSMTLVADEAGVSSGALSSMLGLMQRNIIELGKGTKAQVDAFDRLGLSMASLEGMDADAQFARIAEALNLIEDPAAKTATAMDIFGRSGRAAINMLDDYSGKVEEATRFQDEFGISVSEFDASQIEAANDAMGRVGMAMAGIGNTFAIAVAPALISVSEGFLALIGEGGTLRTVLSGVSDNLDVLANSVGVLAVGLTVKAIPAIYATVTATGFLTGAMVALRTAIILTGIGALVVGAGYLITKFIDLSEEAGGVGNALALMGDVARAVFTGMGKMLSGFADKFRALGFTMNAIWLKSLSWMAQKFADFIQTIGDPLNRLTALMGDALQIDTMGIQAWASTFEAAVLRSESVADAFATSGADKMATAFDGVTIAVQAMRDVMAGGALPVEPGKAPSKTDRTPEIDPPIIPGLPGAGSVASAFAERLEALQTGLMTEMETIEAWRTAGLETLNEALANELITTAEHQDAMLRLEEGYQQQLAAIRQEGADFSVNAALSGGADVLGAMGSFNKKALKLSKAFAAAEAFVSAYQGAAAALKKGALGFPEAAAVIAKGMGFVAAIKGVNANGGGGSSWSGGGVSGGGSSGGGSRNSGPVTNFSVSLVGAGDFSRGQVIELMEMFNDAAAGGSNININGDWS